MDNNARLNIIGRADVKAAVAAAQNVDEPGLHNKKTLDVINGNSHKVYIVK